MYILKPPAALFYIRPTPLGGCFQGWWGGGGEKNLALYITVNREIVL